MRYCIGVYPKWIGRIIRWAIVRNGSSKCSVEFKGRGMRGKWVKTEDGRKVRMSRYYRYGAPVSKAGKVAIYICPPRKSAGQRYHEAERRFVATTQ